MPDVMPNVFCASRDDAIWYGLNTVDQLWSMLWSLQANREHIRIVTGNTAYGIQPMQPTIDKQNIMLYIGNIPQLTEIDEIVNDGNSITARCSVPIQRLQDTMKKLADAHKHHNEQSSCPAQIAYDHWQRLATTEIRNVGSIAGNLYLARVCCFPSDLAVVLTTLGATVTIAGPTDSQLTIHKKSLTMTEFLNKNGVLDGANIIYEVEIPIAVQANVFIRTYKVSQRPQNSHCNVNGGFSVQIIGNTFQDVRIVFGNIGTKTCRMPITEKWMEMNSTPANIYQCVSTEYSIES